MPSVNVSVVVADDHLRGPKFSAVVRRLKRAGLHVEAELHEAGVLTGSADTGKVEGLRKAKGVSAVEVSGGVQIAPPDSEIQ